MSAAATARRLAPVSPGSPRRLLVPAGYVALFLAAFYVGLVVVFPVDTLRRALVGEVERNGPLTLAMGDLSVGWLGDLRARNVVLAWPAEDRAVPVLVAERVDLRPALLPLVRGRLSASFAGGAYDGAFSGRVEGPLRGGLERLALRLDRLDLARHVGLARAARGGVTGRLSGEVALRQQAATGRAGPVPVGTIRLALADGSVRDLPIVGASLPVVTVERASANGALRGERLEIEELSARGPEVSVAGSGQIGLRAPLEASTLNGTLRLTPESRLPPTLRRLLAAVGRAPDATGAYGFVLVGTVGNAELRPL